MFCFQKMIGYLSNLNDMDFFFLCHIGNLCPGVSNTVEKLYNLWTKTSFPFCCCCCFVFLHIITIFLWL